MKDVLSRFAGSHILVVGDFMVDEYIKGSVERISPEAPVPVVVEREVRTVPGGAGNVVRNLRSLGAQVSVAGVVGQDEAAGILRADFARLGLSEADSAGLIAVADRPTTRKTRIMAGQQQIVRLDRESEAALSDGSRAKIIAAIQNFVENATPRVQAIILSDYDKGVIRPDVIQATVEVARRHDCFIAVDPQVTHFQDYKDVGVLTPNHHEAGRHLKRKLVDDADVHAGGLEILESLRAKMLLITRGEKGITLFQAGQKTAENFPTMAREVFDVTGAGDTVISVFTLAIAAGASAQDAVRLSNLAAGQVVAHLGAATVTVSELEAAL
ncbi:MAG: D-glycero-beta-D-manno-heptose-7-phosphate kinase [bacterium]|nr:D-glycero-beta-D-manno-heptose-7-phosphate kinase [bacterium]